MAFRKNNAVVIASILALAALVCLGVGLRLLSASEPPALDTDLLSSYQFAATLTIVGGLVVFLLGAIALLAARRYALGAKRAPDSLPPELGLVDIQNWGRELVEIRDSLRHDPATETNGLEINLLTLEVPESWHAEEQYLLRPDGRPSDPLADLKRIRERLQEAATRVDAIVQSINMIDVTGPAVVSYERNLSKDRYWRRFLRKFWNSAQII